MDWRSITFDWNRARAFLVTAEEGSLSAAARALNMTQPTLGRQVSALEEELGVTLFERVGRGLVLTESGLHLVEHVRAMGEAAGRVSLAAGGQSQEVAGHVAITASELYSAWLLPPVIARLRAEAPGLVVDVVASNAVRDLKRREADIAIRNTRPEQAELVARRVAEDSGTLYAAPGYLDRLGPLTGLGDLARAEFIGFDETDRYIAMLNQLGAPVTEANFPLICDSHLVQWDMARRGLGIAAGPHGLGDADPTLRRVLPEEPDFHYPVWLVAHRELRTSRRVRLVFDLLAEMLPGLLRGGA
ncbi:LysR family transcriptional regulator [Salipiger mucosus]|nr:LysR family transcriptional regulator [Salipiger mucosus]